MGPLSTIDISAAKEEFERDGYARFPAFLDAAEVDQTRENVERFIRDCVPNMPREQVFFEDVKQFGTLKQLQHLDHYDPFFDGLITGSRFEQVASLLLDAPIVSKNLQYFNKPAGVGRPTPPHQDGFYFMLDPCEAVTMWLALDPVDEVNGCVRYIKGSHRRGMRPHGRSGTLGFSQGITDFGSDEDRAHEQAIPAQPGDLLVHHSMAIHRADGNQSLDRSRRALGLIYYSIHAREDAEAHAAYQKKLSQELLSEGKI